MSKVHYINYPKQLPLWLTSADFWGVLDTAWYIQSQKRFIVSQSYENRNLSLSEALLCWSGSISSLNQLWTGIQFLCVWWVIFCPLICDYIWDSFRSLCMLWHVINRSCVRLHVKHKYFFDFLSFIFCVVWRKPWLCICTFFNYTDYSYGFVQY